MLNLLKNPVFFQYLSLAGVLSAVLGALVAAAAYRGKNGERYSILNHYISELGEVGVSRLAWAFNLGLILSGLCLLPSTISLGLLIPGAWSKIGMAAGIIAAVSLALVGVFPMNKITPHSRVALTYFRLGLVMVIFFTLAIAVQPKALSLLPRLFGLAGLPAILSFSFFLIYSQIVYSKAKGSDAPAEIIRPRFWGVAFAEWTIFLTIVPFFLVLALGL